MPVDPLNTVTDQELVKDATNTAAQGAATVSAAMVQAVTTYLEGEIQKNLASIQSNKTEIDALSGGVDLSGILADIAAIKEAFDTNQDGALNDLTNLIQRMTTAENTLVNAGVRLTSLEGITDTINGLVSAMKSVQDTHSTEIATLNSTATAHNQRIAALEALDFADTVRTDAEIRAIAEQAAAAQARATLGAVRDAGQAFVNSLTMSINITHPATGLGDAVLAHTGVKTFADAGGDGGSDAGAGAPV